MGLLSLFRRKAEPVAEVRSSGAGYTAAIMAARESWISGQSGLAELSGTVQACVSLWEAAFTTADVDGAPQLDRFTMGLMARALAFRGEAVFLLDGDRAVPCADWDVATVDGRPRAYRLSVSEAGGGRSFTALAPEVLHVRLAADPVAPWAGVAPLRRARLSAQLLHELETALAEVWSMAPVGSQVIPFPEAEGLDLDSLARDFRGRRGRVMLRESVNVAAAGGPAPASDWRPQSTTPELERAMPVATLETARASIFAVFGVLPALFDRAAQGPLVREAQRHLAAWTLQPLADLISEEATAKIGAPVRIDVMRPLQAFDVGGKARALSGILDAMATAKANGLTPAEVEAALRLVNWQDSVG